MVAFLGNDVEHAVVEMDALHHNRLFASLLDEIAVLLTEQHANGFRILSYRNAAKTLRELREPVREILETKGLPGLIALPTIGHSIAGLIDEYLRSGRLAMLDRLRGDEISERLFSTLPNVGPKLAHRIRDQLHIETLPELYAAAQSGRLQEVAGIGRKRADAIRQCLAARVHSHRSTTHSTSVVPDELIPVGELLDVDKEYRRLASENKLPKIAPTKFNASGIAWLPILHTERDGRHYTALYSNTARAHELNTVKDWVVIYRDDAKSHERWTVITAQFGKLHGWRIVPGREDECEQHYFATRRKAPSPESKTPDETPQAAQ